MKNASQFNFRNVKAIALDLDGTALTPEKKFSGRTLKSLKNCMKKGIQVIICTGRAVEAAEPYRAELGTEGPMVYFNGAEVVNMPAGKLIQSVLLKMDVVNFCVDMARSEDLHYQIFLPDQGLIAEKEGKESEMYRNHTGMSPVIGDLKAIASGGADGCIKSMFITDPEKHETIKAKLIDKFGGSIYITCSYPVFLEVLAAGVSKGAGLKTAMDARGLKREEVIAIGDEENDLPMFSAAGFSAAPSNAKDTVKKAAGIVIGSNAEDGVAVFLEENLLNSYGGGH
jgi:Cof subfamily protein (haloacid dehalogenase superfamily)